MVYSTVRFAALEDAPEEAQIMRISIAELQFAGFSERFVQVVNFEMVYSTVRFAALKDAPEEARLMRISSAEL